MTKLMRKLPLVIAALFLIVQITGLTDYATRYGGLLQWRGAVFSVALEAGIFGAAYWLRQSITSADKRDIRSRVAAAIALIIFLVASGFLNTAKSIRDLPQTSDRLDLISAYVFGIVPTLFATVLGVLQGFIDRLPYAQGRQAQDTIPMRVYAMAVKALAILDARLDRSSSTSQPQDAHAGLHECKQCGAWVKNVGAHVRWQHKKP